MSLGRLQALAARALDTATHHGIDHVGMCSAEPFLDVRTTLEARKAEGLSGSMQFTYRNPSRSTDPAASLPGARSLFVGLLSYNRTDAESTETNNRAAIASYVWEPYYERLTAGLRAVADVIEADGWKCRVLVDSNALVDRAAAHRAGLAWWGKNANLLVPGEGSRFVIGSIVTDAPLYEVQNPVAPVEDGCGPCRRCIDACPTDAIVADGVIDATRCLAWLVQADGVFPTEHRRALGGRLYGCDECQSSCPPNVLADRHAAPQPTIGAATVDLVDMLSQSDQVLMERHGAWYIPHREARYLRRNAFIALANVADPNDPTVYDAVHSGILAADEIVRSHAVWAAGQLGFDDLISRVGDDSSPIVRRELEALS